MAWGKAKASKDSHDNEGVDYHPSWVMNNDGTRSSTWVSCHCSAAQPGSDGHDGPTPVIPVVPKG